MKAIVQENVMIMSQVASKTEYKSVNFFSILKEDTEDVTDRSVNMEVNIQRCQNVKVLTCGHNLHNLINFYLQFRTQLSLFKHTKELP